MKVKELITRLLDEPMEAEVCLQDPTEHVSNGIICKGYLFDITYVEPWNKHRICINFKDWRKDMEQVDEPQEVCDRPQRDCENCWKELHCRAKDEPTKTLAYCDSCNHKGCENCIADNSNPYCAPSNYEPKTGYCNECKWFRDKQVCGRCRSKNLYAPKDESQTERSE